MIIKIINRRVLLQGFAATHCLAAIGWPQLGLSASEALSTQHITDKILVIAGAGGNVVLYQGREGLTLIDSGTLEKTAELLQLVDKLSSAAPIHTLFNTHWHEDHTGGNEAVHARGAKIIAHVNTKLWLGADFDVHWRQSSHKPRPQEALPDQTFYTDGQLDLGGEIVNYGNFPQAHTDGDMFVYFPDSNVMVAGGLLSNHTYPIANIATGGWIGGLINANAAMLAMINDNTVIIPDRGPARSKADLQAQHDMLADLFAQMKELVRQGLDDQGMLELKVTKAYDPLWGDPVEFVMETYRGMWAHTSDMGGFI